MEREVMHWNGLLKEVVEVCGYGTKRHSLLMGFSRSG